MRHATDPGVPTVFADTLDASIVCNVFHAFHILPIKRLYKKVKLIRVSWCTLIAVGAPSNDCVEHGHIVAEWTSCRIRNNDICPVLVFGIEDDEFLYYLSHFKVPFFFWCQRSSRLKSSASSGPTMCRTQ